MLWPEHWVLLCLQPEINLPKQQELGIDLQAVLDKKITPTADQLKLLAENKIRVIIQLLQVLPFIICLNFLWCLLILCGVASILLFYAYPEIEKNDAWGR